MPGRVKTVVICLALVLAYYAGPSVASGAEPSAGSGTAPGPQPAQSGRTVQTELEYLTSRQSADARKAQKVAPAVTAPASASNVPPAQRAARSSPKTAPVAASASVEKGPMRAEEIPVAGDRAERSTVNRNRRNVHHAPTWSLSFFFSGLRDVIVSSRVQYLPLLGSAPVRFTSAQEFDRANLMGLRQFDERMGEVSISTAAPEKAKNPADSSPIAASASPAGSAAHPTAPESETVRMGAKATVSGTTTGGTVAVSSGVVPGAAPESAAAQNVDYTPVNSEVVLRYFDKNGRPAPGNTNGAAGAQAQVRVGMPFVMPYQNDQPLIMDSSATYRQTDDAAQSGTSAK